MAGIYIHIPFCKQACTYCNFHFSTQRTLKSEWLSALQNEIILQSDYFPTAETISTIYFGGGTPSLLAVKELETILQTLRRYFIIEDDAEITLEANPDDITINNLQDWLWVGINRLSLGIQTFVDSELSWMNRAHNASMALKSLDWIAASAFTNLSVDIIFGSPLITDEALLNNLKIVTERNIPHISCYALTVEEKTALHHFVQTKKTSGVDSDKQARQFFLTMETLRRSGYEHYEISNYAQKGMRSRHNSNYWNGTAYLGLGPSAHSFDGNNKRRWNIANNSLYIQQLKNNQLPFEEEILTFDQQMNEYIMTSIRKAEGIELSVFKERFGEPYLAQLLAACNQIDKNGYLIKSHESITLTDTGKLFADGLSANLFF